MVEKCPKADFSPKKRFFFSSICVFLCLGGRGKFAVLFVRRRILRIGFSVAGHAQCSVACGSYLGKFSHKGSSRAFPFGVLPAFRLTPLGVQPEVFFVGPFAASSQQLWPQLLGTARGQVKAKARPSQGQGKAKSRPLGLDLALTCLLVGAEGAHSASTRWALPESRPSQG